MERISVTGLNPSGGFSTGRMHLERHAGILYPRNVKSLPGKFGSRARKRGRREATENENNAVLELVREGVRRFILKDAPIGDFQKAIRTAAKRGEGSSHPLTRAVFRRIVRAAIHERSRRTGGGKP